MIDLSNALKHNIDEAVSILHDIKDKEIDFSKCKDVVNPWVLLTDFDGNIYDALVYKCYLLSDGSIGLEAAYEWDLAHHIQISLLDCLSTTASNVCECISRYVTATEQK